MPDKLIWSWTLEDNRILAQANGLPLWTEKITYIFAGCISVIILFFILEPFVSKILLYPALISILYVFYKKITDNKKIKTLEKEAYLKIYTDGISLNLEGLYGFYKSENICLNTLEVDNIHIGSHINTWKIKGLRFKTKKPDMDIVVPLTRLMSQSRFELENIINEIKSANDIDQ